MSGNLGPEMAQRFDISSAQILSAFSSPVSLIGAAGAGKIIVPTSFAVELVYGGTPYGGGIQGVIGYSGNPIIPGGAAYIDLSKGANNIWLGTAADLNAIVDTSVVNQPLLFWVQTSNPTGGNGTLKAIISYYVADFSY